jgi:hypothetical protein
VRITILGSATLEGAKLGAPKQLLPMFASRSVPGPLFSDRYLPAILYGCIPVFIKEEEAGPFDEIINWSLVSLQLRPRHVNRSMPP